MEFSSLPHAGDRSSAEVERIVHCLEHYGGVLTRARLREGCDGASWPTGESFHAALSRAVKSGRVRKLSNDLYEVVS